MIEKSQNNSNNEYRLALKCSRFVGRHPNVIKQIHDNTTFGILVRGYDEGTYKDYYYLSTGLYYVKNLEEVEYYLFYDGIMDKPKRFKTTITQEQKRKLLELVKES